MSMKDCINRAVAAGEMDVERARIVLNEYDNILPGLEQNMGRTQAEAQAARLVVKRWTDEAFQRRRKAQLQAAVAKTLGERMVAHRDVKGRVNPGKFLMDLVQLQRGAIGETLSGKLQSVRRYLMRDFQAAVKTFRANIIGARRNKQTLTNMVREVFGEDTGDQVAKRFAQQWLEISERARTRFNAAGGHIGKLEGWGLPQAHNARRVAKAGYEAWRDAILPKLDLQKMADRWNDGVPYSPQSLEVIMRDAWDAIRTDGRSRREPTSIKGKALANKRADHRFFAFKDADAWMAYNAEFGTGKDPFRVMLKHLDSMAMDITMLEVLGPSPNSMFAWLADKAEIIASRSGDQKLLQKTARRVKFAREMLDEFTGVSNMPVHEGAARGAAAVRNFLSAAHLGSAVVSSITDFNTSRVAAGMAGLSQSGPVRQLARLMVSPEFRQVAAEAGLVFENAVDVGNAVARYQMEEMPVEMAARLADGVIRASGLGWLTEVQRQAFGMEFMQEAARKWHGKKFSDLPARTQEMWRSYGIGEAEWAAIGLAQVHETANGVRLLRAQEIEAAVGQRIADLYMEAVVSLTELAVPTTDISSRTLVKFGTKPGTLPGELVRFGLQFKSFPATVVAVQVGRVMQEWYRVGAMSAVKYAAGLFIGSTLLGGVALQIKEIVKGRDPRDMTTGKFWSAAIMQGGGLGIFGDFFFSDVNRFGGGLAQTLAGPGVGFANDLVKVSVGNVQKATRGDEVDLAGDMLRMARRYTPGGSLWYLRLAYEREVLDAIQIMADPDAYRSFNRRIRAAQDYDTKYFAPPGSSLLSGRGRIRAPDFQNALGR